MCGIFCKWRWHDFHLKSKGAKYKQSEGILSLSIALGDDAELADKVYWVKEKLQEIVRDGVNASLTFR